MAAYRKGESDLVCRDGKWFLYATCQIPEADLREPDGFIGVDLGIANIATTSDGTRYAGRHLNRVRHRNRALRRKLQAKGTKSARRLLRKRARKESRFAADTNHRIAKRIVTEAQRTGRGIALEDLQGIRGRVRLRKPQRRVSELVRRFRLDAPTDTLVPLLAALARLRAVPLVQVPQGRTLTLEGDIPATRVHELRQELPALTRGEGVLECAFDRYEPVTGVGPARPRLGPDPLNREEYLQQVTRRVLTARSPAG